MDTKDYKEEAYRQLLKQPKPIDDDPTFKFNHELKNWFKQEAPSHSGGYLHWNPNNGPTTPQFKSATKNSQTYFISTRQTNSCQL